MGKPAQTRRKSRGRPSKFTPDVRGVICQAVQLGATDEVAAEEAGVTHRTLMRWLADDRPEYVAFRQEFQRAKDCRPKAVLCRLAFYDDWKADDAYLKSIERRGERAHRLGKMELENAKLAAEVRIIEAKARAAEEALESGGGMLVLFGDLLDQLPEHLRHPLVAWLGERGHSAVSTPLAPSPPDPKLLERITPTPAAREP